MTARRTHCKAEGHPLTEENIYISPTGTRECATCKRRRNAEAYAKAKEARRLKREQRAKGEGDSWA